MANTVTIGGRTYVARYQEFPFEQSITIAGQTLLNQRLVLPGIAPFYLQALKAVTVNGGVTVTRLFKFRFGNTDGGLWYAQAGVGGSNDRIMSPLMFGTAQFPKPITPGILFQPSASIMMEIEDISLTVPYTISMSFEGNYLFE